MIYHVDLAQNSYDIVMERGCLHRADTFLDLNRRVLIVTDQGVPEIYARIIAEQCRSPIVITVRQGEESKSFSVLETLLSKMLASGFTRNDCVIAVGGGVVGDLAGFAASIYMRGIDFYNIPTTVLSQVDSSIGGKTAVNLDGIKNIAGTFYQPKKVLIDTKVLETLPARQIANGLAEAVKMALTFDLELFELFEKQDPRFYLDEMIQRSIQIKSRVVIQDEKEQGLRKVLNFGHTIGHGIESSVGMSGYYHGECVALGMIPMCSDTVRKRLLPVLLKLGLPIKMELDADRVYQAMLHDKKMAGGAIMVTVVDEIGSFRFCRITPADLKNALSRLT